MKKFLLLILCTMCMTAVNARYELTALSTQFQGKQAIKGACLADKAVLAERQQMSFEAAKKASTTKKSVRRQVSPAGCPLVARPMIESVYNDYSTEEEQIDPFYTAAPVTFSACDETVTNIFTEEEVKCNIRIEGIFNGYGQEVYGYFDAVNDTLHIPGQIIYTHQTYGSFATACMVVDAEDNAELMPWMTYDVHEDADSHLLSLTTHQIEGYEQTVNVTYIVDGDYAGQLWSVYWDDEFSYHQPNYTMHFQTRQINSQTESWDPWSEEQTCPVYVEDFGDSFMVHNWYHDFYYGALNTVLMANMTSETEFEVPFLQPVVYYQGTMISLANMRGDEPNDPATGFIAENGTYFFGAVGTDPETQQPFFDPMAVFITPDDGSRWYGVIDGYIVLTPEEYDPEGVNTVLAPEANKAYQPYNLAGQRVNAAAKGIQVRGGEKFLQK